MNKPAPNDWDRVFLIPILRLDDNDQFIGEKTRIKFNLGIFHIYPSLGQKKPV